MKNRKFYTSLVCVLIIFSISLNAQEVKKSNSLVFTSIKIPSENVSDSFIDDVSEIIKENLKGESFFIIRDLYNPYSEITFNNCIKNQCTAELPNAVSEGVVLLIHLKSITVKTGERKLSRYVVEDITETRYTFYISAAEIPKSSYDLEFTGTFTEKSKLINEADSIGKKIRDFYIKRKPEVQEEKTGSRNDQSSSDYYDIIGASFSMSKIKPAGSFNGIADDGYGANIGLNGVLPVFPVIEINPGLSFYYLGTTTDNINSAYMILPEITAGYNFIIDQELSFLPLLGAGYSLMYVDGTTGDDPENEDSKVYYNPVLKMGIEGTYFFSDNYSIFCGLSYNCIFEQDSVLYFGSFNLGIRIRL